MPTDTRSPIAVPFVQWPLGSGLRPHARSPLGQRLAGALRTRVLRSQGRLDRLELVLVHTIAAGTGWSTDWRVRASIEVMPSGRPDGAGPATGAAGGTARTGARLALRSVDRGALPPGPALDLLWDWVVDTSAEQSLAPALLSERVQFEDAAALASIDVIRHRVLRAAAVLERLPASLEVGLGRRRRPPDGDQEDAAGQPEGSALPAQGQPAAKAGTKPNPAGATVPVVRLIARFPGRGGSRGDTRVVLWSEDRHPALVALLRDCAQRLAPRQAAADPAAPGTPPA